MKPSFQYLTLLVEKDVLEVVSSWYIRHFLFDKVWESSAFLLLSGDEGAQLGFHVGKSLSEPHQIQIHLQVENVDDAYSRLEAEGLEFVSAPKDTDWGFRVAETRDPAGHIVEIYSEIE